MATYTIHINEQTQEGRSLVNYLRELGLIAPDSVDDGIEVTRRAMRELRQGKVTHCKDFNEYLDSVK